MLLLLFLSLLLRVAETSVAAVAVVVELLLLLLSGVTSVVLILLRLQKWKCVSVGVLFSSLLKKSCLVQRNSGENEGKNDTSTSLPGNWRGKRSKRTAVAGKAEKERTSAIAESVYPRVQFLA